MAAARHQPGIAQRHVVLFRAGWPAEIGARCPCASAARRRIPWRARSMKPSITLPIATRSFSRRWPHSPSRLTSISLTMALDRSAKAAHLRRAASRRRTGDGGWPWIAAFSASMRANRISPTRPISVLEISVSSVWRRDQQGQAQRFPGPLQPVHRHHRDIGRDIGIALRSARHRFRATARAAPRSDAAPAGAAAPELLAIASPSLQQQRHFARVRRLSRRPVCFCAAWRARARSPALRASRRRPAARIARRAPARRRACRTGSAPWLRGNRLAFPPAAESVPSQFQTGTRLARAMTAFLLVLARRRRRADPRRAGRTGAAASACARNCRGAATGRRPSRMSSCGRAWPSISRSTSTAMRKRAAAVPGRLPRNVLQQSGLVVGQHRSLNSPPLRPCQH